MLDKMNFIETENEKYPLMFTLNVMEKIQEEYGSINAWSDLVQKEGEPDILTDNRCQKLSYILNFWERSNISLLTFLFAGLLRKSHVSS